MGQKVGNTSINGGARALPTFPAFPPMTFPHRPAAFEFLSAVSRGEIKRTTLSRVAAAARTLGLSERVDHSPYGYWVSKGWQITPCQNLQAVCEALLWAFATAPVLPAEKARTLYRQTVSGHRVAWDEPSENF
jgi:hypothetical protein